MYLHHPPGLFDIIPGYFREGWATCHLLFTLQMHGVLLIIEVGIYLHTLLNNGQIVTDLPPRLSGRGGVSQPSTFNPLPSTLNPQPSTPQPSTLNPQPSTLYPQPSTPQPSTLNPQPSTLNPQPSTLNCQPATTTGGAPSRGCNAPTSGAPSALLQRLGFRVEGSPHIPHPTPLTPHPTAYTSHP